MCRHHLNTYRFGRAVRSRLHNSQKLSQTNMTQASEISRDSYKASLDKILGSGGEDISIDELEGVEARGWDEESSPLVLKEGFCVECEGESSFLCSHFSG